MKLTIIGASAGIGLNAVQQALNKGHQVTALSTQASTMAAHELLLQVNGSATSVEDLKRVMAGADAVMITVGTKDKKPNTLFSDTARAVVKAGADLNFRGPVLVITGFGAGESSAYLSFFMRAVISLFLKHQYKDKTLMEEILSGSPLNWEMVRPGMLTNGPLTESYQVITSLSKRLKVGKISRADVADFLIREAEQPKHLLHYPALTN